jgi:hypothetical protein
MRNITDFLQNYEILIKKPTFLKIADFPRWENVWSNILCFYLNNEHHEMNGFLLKCLAEAIGKTDISGDDILAEREVHTKIGNRIDIFVKTKNYCFFIENKVDAPEDNDFNDYLVYTKNIALKSFAIDKQDNFFGVVIKRKKEEEKEDRNKRLLYLSYNDFLFIIRKKINSILFSSDNKYLMFFIDFIENISDVMEVKMDLKFYEQYLIYNKEIKDISNKYNSLKIFRKDVVIDHKKRLYNKYDNIAEIDFDGNHTVCLKLSEFKIKIVYLLNGISLKLIIENEHKKKIESLFKDYSESFTLENEEYLWRKDEFYLNNLDKFEEKFLQEIEPIINNYKIK